METELVAGIGGAFVGAILTGFFAWWMHSTEQVSVKKDELRKILMNLLDLRERFQTEVAAIQDPQHQETAGLFINNKRVIYLEAAETLVEQIPKNVSSSEYGSLAYEFWADSNFLAAEKYYLKSVEAARPTLMKVFALRGVAAFYFGYGPHRDFEKGRTYFRNATKLLRNPNDPYSVYTLGYTYQTWGFAELGNGFQMEGNNLIDQAKKYYKDLPDNVPLKNQSLIWLDLKLRQLQGVEIKGQEVSASDVARVGAQLGSSGSKPLGTEAG